MEKRQFLEAIYACRRRLNLAEFLKKAVFALSVGAIVGILFQLVSFVVPFYYANLYTGLALFFAVAAALAVSYVKRIPARQAALVMDGFGFEERIITAYEHLDTEGSLIALQREDAFRQLGAHRDRIRIPVMPSVKKMLPLLGLFILLIGLVLAPSDMKERAGQLHDLRETAKEKEEEIEEVLEALEELPQEQLTPQQQAALQEMMEGLQSSISEYQQADTAELLSMAEQKLDYKYENMSSQLADLAQMLENGAEVSPATAQSMQAMADKLKQMSGKELADNSQDKKQNDKKGQDSQGSNGSNGSQGNQGSQSNQNGSGNAAGSGSGSGDGDSQGSQSGGGSGGDGSQGSQNGSSGDGNGDGDGSGSGNGDGDGQGQGSQGGNSGEGSGNGRGTRSSSTPHDYVSVPNAIADNGNLTGNAVDHDASEYFRAQSGLSWEGQHISHEEVIGSYEQNAYEGIAAGRYPSGMEDVIKQYFSSFNQ